MNLTVVEIRNNKVVKSTHGFDSLDDAMYAAHFYHRVYGNICSIENNGVIVEVIK